VDNVHAVFQLLLLGGYFYSHAVSKLSLRRQAIVHISLLGLSLGVLALGAIFWKTPLLPGSSWRSGPPDSPGAGHPQSLSLAVGLPYLCLSSTGPLLQNWFARAHAAQSPYRLYALSNAGSLLGLITYPFVFEPNLRLHTQAWLWQWDMLLSPPHALCVHEESGLNSTIPLPSTRTKKT